MIQALKRLAPRTRANLRWTEEEDAQLEAWRQDNVDWFEIAARLRRTVAAIERRVQFLKGRERRQLGCAIDTISGAKKP